VQVILVEKSLCCANAFSGHTYLAFMIGKVLPQ